MNAIKILKQLFGIGYTVFLAFFIILFWYHAYHSIGLCVSFFFLIGFQLLLELLILVAIFDICFSQKTDAKQLQGAAGANPAPSTTRPQG